MEKLMEVKNLSVSYFTYAGEVQSVRGISFDVKKGKTTAIVGESGCGKTRKNKHGKSYPISGKRDYRIYRKRMECISWERVFYGLSRCIGFVESNNESWKTD